MRRPEPVTHELLKTSRNDNGPDAVRKFAAEKGCNSTRSAQYFGSGNRVPVGRVAFGRRTQAAVAQLVERRTRNAQVKGSSPFGGSVKKPAARNDRDAGFLLRGRLCSTGNASVPSGKRCEKYERCGDSPAVRLFALFPPSYLSHSADVGGAGGTRSSKRFTDPQGCTPPAAGLAGGLGMERIISSASAISSAVVTLAERFIPRFG